MYHVLGVAPAYKASIGPMLNELCLGLKPDELASVSPCLFLLTDVACVLYDILMLFYFLFFITFKQALCGVYAKDVHVRLACLNALKCIPAVSGRYIPQNIQIATNIWIALHDPEKVCPSHYISS